MTPKELQSLASTSRNVALQEAKGASAYIRLRMAESAERQGLGVEITEKELESSGFSLKPFVSAEAFFRAVSRQLREEGFEAEYKRIEFSGFCRPAIYGLVVRWYLKERACQA